MKHLTGVKTLYVIAVNWMAGVPVELLAPEFTISYVPSGTFLARRGKPLDKPATMLAVGDPLFPKKEAPVVTALPPGGLLITQVVPVGNAAKANIKANEVLVSYAGKKVKSLEELGKLIAENEKAASVEVEIWRESDDKVIKSQVAGGRLGLVLSKDPAREAILANRQANAVLAKARGDDWDELPGTSLEVAKLGTMFPADAFKSLTRSQANERTLDELRASGDLKKYRYLHFATHGKANNTMAFESTLILAQDGPAEEFAPLGKPWMNNHLTAREVLEYWKLDADLVTLSACETAIGKQGSGDGLLGFAQAFLLAGSRSVCLSLWKVDDMATTLLMDRFYRNLLGKREDGTKAMGKAVALHEAKNWLKNLTLAEAAARFGKLSEGVDRGPKKARIEVGSIADPATAPKDAKPFSHPKYWAAFILIGDPD